MVGTKPDTTAMFRNVSIIIGKGGQEVDKLKEELKKVTDKDIQLNIFDVKRQDLDLSLIHI